ncbi:unnamed protein product [Haemonchus placei]|uniref:Uncharacterized protein n=1 Tax=Haemonchus placei TaxID=6290 RepID=A0A3P7ZXH6_HAEPC|nr:unnamed protein product [Haemonchus placei]
MKKSLFQGMFYVPEDVIDAEEKIQEINEVAIPPKPKPSTNFHREGNTKPEADQFENFVTIKREQGEHEVLLIFRKQRNNLLLFILNLIPHSLYASESIELMNIKKE